MARINLHDIEQYLIDFYELEPDQIAVLLTEMSGSIKKRLQELEMSLAEEDPDHIATAAHALKGTLLNFGLIDLAETCSIIDKGSKEGSSSMQSISELFITLRRTLIPVTEAVGGE